jgi:hypothetical protein
MKTYFISTLLVSGGLLLAGAAWGQAPDGPIVPQPGMAIQETPAATKIKLQSI